MKLALVLATAVTMWSLPALSQEVGSDDSITVNNVTVTSGDIKTCPYRFVQPVTVNVTEDYNADTRAKIFGKLREKAKRLGADAVVLVARGDKHMTAWAWNRREYTGRAIRFVDRACAPK